jgi:hypothetical protein
MAKYSKYIGNPEWEFVPYRKNGGNINDFKSSRVDANVEVEGRGKGKKGEFIQLPTSENGTALNGSITGDTHETGGVPMNLPADSIILSDHLKPSMSIFKKKLKKAKLGGNPSESELPLSQISKSDYSKTFAEMAKKYDTANDLKRLDFPYVDNIQKTTAELTIKKKNEKTQKLFTLQEQMKANGDFGKKIQREAIQEAKPEMAKYGIKLKKYQNAGTSKGDVDEYGNPLTPFTKFTYPTKPTPFTSILRKPYYPQQSAPYEGLTPDEMKTRYNVARENTSQYFPSTIIPSSIDKESIGALQYAQTLNSPDAVVHAYSHGLLGFNNEHKNILEKKYKIKSPKASDYEKLTREDIIKGHKDNLPGEDLIRYGTISFTDPEKYKSFRDREAEYVGQGFWIDKNYTRDPTGKTPPTYYKLDISGLNKPAQEEHKSDVITKETSPVEKSNNQFDFSQIQIPAYIPNAYTRDPLNYYNIQPEYINPRYLDIQPQLNDITRGQRAFATNLGSRTSTDVANLLQSQVNAYNQGQQAYGQKYNYDRQQDAQAQEFNARAKQGIDQYNQQAQFAQLEDPRRRRESLMDTQRRTDEQAAIENAMKEKSYNLTRDYIQKTFNPWSQYKDSPVELASAISKYTENLDDEGKKSFQRELGKLIAKSKTGGKVKIKPKVRR